MQKVIPCWAPLCTSMVQLSLCMRDMFQLGILAMPTSRICSETRRFITKIIAWDLQHLLQGKFATLDPLGVPWPKNSLHAKRGGQAMLQRACFAFWKGDQEAHYRAHALHRYYGKSLCCDWCLAKSNDSVLTFADCSMDAVWRRTEEHTAAAPAIFSQDRSPWLAVQGYTKRRRLYDRLLAFHWSSGYRIL